MLKTTNAEPLFIEIWFTDENNRPLEIEDNVNITHIKGYGFLSFARKFGDKCGKKIMNTATKTGINAGKKFRDKYGKKNN